MIPPVQASTTSTRVDFCDAAWYKQLHFTVKFSKPPLHYIAICIPNKFILILLFLQIILDRVNNHELLLEKVSSHENLKVPY
jgi:hypothetical protein